MYKLEYLPIALQDMIEIARYISVELSNPSAVEKISIEITKAADNILLFPYGNPAYIPIKSLKREYRRLLVQNYILFYWIDEASKVVTIARVIYVRLDYEKLL